LNRRLHRALSAANARSHEYATLEHLLLALTEDQDAMAVLRSCGIPSGTQRTAGSNIWIPNWGIWLPKPPWNQNRRRRFSACCNAPLSMCNHPGVKK
jgi:hypothetical protein